MMRDDLGDRMKRDYEQRTRYSLPRRTYTVIRVDGRAFHTFTRGCARPFDDALMAAMDAAAMTLCDQIAGARLAFVQSDEISVLLTDFGTAQTEAWFDGGIQKIVSVSASIATAAFNQERLNQAARNPGLTAGDLAGVKFAQFDSRVFSIPDPVEVENYLIWRQQDATRNSIQMVAQAEFSHRRLQGLNCDALQELLFQEKGINWNDYAPRYKRGRLVDRIMTTKEVAYIDRRTGEARSIDGVQRSEWQVIDTPIFTQDRCFLQARIPRPS